MPADHSKLSVKAFINVSVRLEPVCLRQTDILSYRVDRMVKMLPELYAYMAARIYS